MRPATLLSAAGSFLLCSAFIISPAVKAGPPHFLGDQFSIPTIPVPTASQVPTAPQVFAGSGPRTQTTNIPECHLYFEYRTSAYPQVTSGPPMPVAKDYFVGTGAFNQSAPSSRCIVSKHQAICPSVITNGGTNSNTRPSPAGSKIKP